MSTELDKFPLITGMWPVKGITAGGARIVFKGLRLDAFSPLGAYFKPSEETGLPDLYGFGHIRSMLKCLQFTVCMWIIVFTIMNVKQTYVIIRRLQLHSCNVCVVGST